MDAERFCDADTLLRDACERACVDVEPEAVLGCDKGRNALERERFADMAVITSLLKEKAE